MKTKIKEEEYLTKAELRQKKREEQVAALFEDLAKPCIAEQGLTPERVMTIIANKTDLTVIGVKRILQRLGLYESNAKLKAQFCQ